MQRYTEGMLDAVEKLHELVRVRGLAVLPPRAAEVIGTRPPTRGNLIEAAVRILLDDADGRALGHDVSKSVGREIAKDVSDSISKGLEDAIRRQTQTKPADPHDMPRAPSPWTTPRSPRIGGVAVYGAPGLGVEVDFEAEPAIVSTTTENVSSPAVEYKPPPADESGDES